MNVPLRGKSMQIVEQMVERGYANTKSEAVRQAILNFGERLNKELEIDLVNRKLDKIDKEIAEGKRKLLTPKEAMGKYAKGIK